MFLHLELKRVRSSKHPIKAENGAQIKNEQMQSPKHDKINLRRKQV